METLLFLPLVAGVFVGALFSNFVLDALYNLASILLKKIAGCFVLMRCGIRVMVPFLIKPLFCLQSVIVEFPDQIHL